MESNKTVMLKNAIKMQHASRFYCVQYNIQNVNFAPANGPKSYLTHPQTQKVGKTENRKDGTTERRKDEKTERRKDGKTERRKDGKTERQIDTKTEKQNIPEV